MFMKTNMWKRVGMVLSFLLLIGSSSIAFAQVKTVNGKVVDAAGDPVIGAGVIVLQDKDKGTVTDFDGLFSIAVAPGQTLQVSSVGFITKDVVVPADGSVLNIVLEEDVNLLDDVIVIGYGTAKKSDLTGATSSLGGERISSKNKPLLANQLQGSMAGVQVTRSSGDPSSSASIIVRGITSTASTAPLVIIDGIPGSINDVASDNIKDIQVLKDAASASIYGARAAAGVILITTKRAKINELRLSYGFEYGVDTPTARPEFIGSIDWMQGLNEVSYNGGATSQYSQYAKDYIENYAQNHIKDPDLYPDSDWMSAGLAKSATHKRHSFNLSGGTSKLKTNFSVNYYDADGLSPKQNYKRFNIRSNNDYNVNEWIHASADVNITYGSKTAPHFQEGSILQSLMFRAPIYPIWYADGEYAYGKSGDNSIAAMDLAGKKLDDTYNLASKLQLDFTLLKGLTVSAAVAPSLMFFEEKDHSVGFKLRDSGGDYKPATQYGSTQVQELRNSSRSLTTQFYANYKLDAKKHSFNAMAGYEGYYYEYANVSAKRTNYSLDAYPYLSVGPEDYQYNTGVGNHQAYNSVFGRIMYSYANKYLLQANVRADASSRFANGYRWGTFPSVSAGWVISEEPWFNVNGINTLKLRASAGQLGNEQISGNYFPYMATLSLGTAYLPTTAGSVELAQTGYQMDYAFNDITWETTTSYDLGLDLSALDSRLRFSGDVYYKKTTDMLEYIGFPLYFGYNAPKYNVADMHTTGWEFEIAWNDQIGDFAYGASFNLSDYRSKMGYMSDRRNISGNKLIEEGSYYQEWYMWESDGIILNEAGMKNADGSKIATVNGNDKPGCIKYVNQNDDNVINDADKVKLGNSLPEYQYGASFFANWKGFDFNLSLQGIGHQRSYWSWPVQPFNLQAYACPKVAYDSHWSPFATDEQNAKAKYPAFTTNTANVYGASDFYLFNGAYMRVKDITLGYTIPQNLTQKIKINSLRFYVSCNDLPAFSKYPKGYDPEWNRSGDLIMSSYIFGLNINF